MTTFPVMLRVRLGKGSGSFQAAKNIWPPGGGHILKILDLPYRTTDASELVTVISLPALTT